MSARETQAALRDLLQAVEALFPDEDWKQYEGVAFRERITCELLCLGHELVALRQAIGKAKEVLR